jgi:hypothetical protein
MLLIKLVRDLGRDAPQARRAAILSAWSISVERLAFDKRQMGLCRLGTKSSQTLRWREPDSNQRCLVIATMAIA